ncbi:MAG: calcineurin-like phosphoesterase C-terminal domain-containing protein [Bacteroidales bacterium]|nr:calcineurin-like phosphoesterase C-terminal domain-containing protein [Bacteroidales bacterium]
MRVLRNSALFTAVLLSFAVSCTKDLPAQGPVAEEIIITATASLPDLRTKMIYEEGEGGIRTGWQTGDTFLALEVNGSSVTPVRFTANAAAGSKASFTSSGAVSAGAGTKWVAVLGKGASFSGTSVNCTYSGQTGSLKGLEGFDYMVAESSGESPDFSFGNGKHLTYLLRIKMPEGVGQIEFNTAAAGSEWTVSGDGSVSGCTADYRPAAARTLKLSSQTSSGDVVYLAVPAINYSEAGLIVTALSQNGRKSQGKVLSADLSSRGGKTGTFDMSGSPLIDRPLPADAIDFVSKSGSTLIYINNTSWGGVQDIFDFSTRPSWAPFNVGAKASPATAEEAYGNFFAWGETEQRGSYTAAGYRYAGKEIGYIREHRGRADIPVSFRTISGTKYDVARVKWGSAWRMPFLEEILGLMGGNESVTTTSGARLTTASSIITTDVKEWNGISVSGRTFSRNGITLFLPFAGRYYYTSGAAATSPSMAGKAGYYLSGAHNNMAGRDEAYQISIRNNQIDYAAQGAGHAFSVRPVLATDSDEPAAPVAISGKVTDASTGQGIPGVTVSDGYNCVRTDASGTYTLSARAAARTVQITVPAAYEIPLDGKGQPAFWQKIIPGRTADFSLTPRSSSGSRFSIVFVSDAHVQDASNLTRFKASLQDVQGTVDGLGGSAPVVGIALGDQLWDNMAMADDVIGAYSSLSSAGRTVPFMYVIGNHDHQSGQGDSDYKATQYYVDHFGPTEYSFDIGNAHVIVADNIDYTGNDSAGSGGFNKIEYRERFSGDTFHWIKEDVANVSDKRGKIAIFCTHSPFYNAPGNGEGVKSLLYGFNEVHIFSGHIHNLTNYYFLGNKAAGGRTLVEHNIQSLCGMWWLGDISPNGTPAGYGVYTFEGASLVSEFNKVTGKDKGFQMRVYSGNDSYAGYAWDSKYQGKLLVRVWDGDDPRITAGSELTWSLSFEYGGTSTPMTRLPETIVDKCSAAKIVKDLNSPHGTGPNAKSYSWWAVDVPGGSPESLSGWKVVARHTLPGGWSATYTENQLTRDYHTL